MDKWIVYTLVVILGIICIFGNNIRLSLNKPKINEYIVQNEILENNTEIENKVENKVINTIENTIENTTGNTIENVIKENENLKDDEKGPWKISEDKETIINKANGDLKKVGGIISNDEVLKNTGGTKSSYKGTWTILGVEEGKLKLVSTENVGIKSLGYEDEEAIKAIQVVDNNITDEEKFKRSMWSYKNAIENLSQIASKETGILNARSITIEDFEKVFDIREDDKKVHNGSYGDRVRYCFKGDNETGKIYGQYLFYGMEYKEENWTELKESRENIFISQDEIINGSKENKDNVIEFKTNYYSYNYNEERYNEYANSLGKGAYWIGSQCVECNTGFVSFKIFVSERCNIQASSIFNSNAYSSAYTETKRC